MHDDVHTGAVRHQRGLLSRRSVSQSRQTAEAEAAADLAASRSLRSSSPGVTELSAFCAVIDLRGSEASFTHRHCGGRIAPPLRPSRGSVQARGPTVSKKQVRCLSL